MSWLDWSLTPGAARMLRFTREMIALRKRHPSLRRRRFPEADEIHWYGETLEAADLGRPRRARAALYAARRDAPASPRCT